MTNRARLDLPCSRPLGAGRSPATVIRSEVRRAPRWLPAALVLTLLAGVAPSKAAEATNSAPSSAVSAQGLFAAPLGATNSPLGLYKMQFTLAGGPQNRLLAEVRIDASGGAIDGRAGGTWLLHRIAGPTLWISDLGLVVALETFDPPELPGTLRIYDLDGREVHQESILTPTDAGLSPDGRSFWCRTPDGLVSLDLQTFQRATAPLYPRFAPGRDGAVAGITAQGNIEVRGLKPTPLTCPLPGQPLALAFTPDGQAVLILEFDRLLRLDPSTARLETLFSAAAGEELRDLRVRPTGIEVGIRRQNGVRSEGFLASLTLNGQLLDRRAGAAGDYPKADFAPAEPAPSQLHGDARRGTISGPAAIQGTGLPWPSIPWPLLPNSQHPVGNTYNEYQNYGGSPYPHPGVDVFGSPGQHVYAVHSGVVKAILTTGGDLYWRIAIADTTGSGTLPGYLYAHLVQSSIPVTVGQSITQGQYLGDLVNWPVAGFTHTHFARIQDTGAQWYGAWTCIGNPQLYLQNQSDALPPVFEPARGTALLAFCANETSSYQDPTQIHGPVDIIAHVGDRIISTYVCTVQELRYTIYPDGHPEAPLVNDKLAVFYDMPNDYYAGGSYYTLLDNILYKQDSVCRTQGDYDFREFYQILTNSDGDQSYGQEDLAQCWDTSTIPDGAYVIRVTARDVAGNATVDSMTVQTVNGNPSSVDLSRQPVEQVSCRPNPTMGAASILFSLPASGRVTLGIYDPAGRSVRSLLDGLLAPGAHQVIWDGRLESGRKADGGIYFYRLATAAGARAGRIVLVGN